MIGIDQAFQQLMHENQTSAKFIAYADDLLLVVKGLALNKLTPMAKRLIEATDEFLANSRIRRSAKKSGSMIYLQTSTGQTSGQWHKAPKDLTIGSESVKMGKSMKFLGVTFDNRGGGSFATHCSQLYKRHSPFWQKLSSRGAQKQLSLKREDLAFVYCTLFYAQITHGECA